jgi:hypothetical protein
MDSGICDVDVQRRRRRRIRNGGILIFLGTLGTLVALLIQNCGTVPARGTTVTTAAVEVAEFACGATPKGEEIKLDGPKEAVSPGDWVDIGVSGLSADDLKKTKILYYPRQGARARGVLGWSGETSIDFRATNPGTYLLAVVAPSQDGLRYAEIEIQVGPKPNPTPPPDPTPVPGVFKWTIIVYESGDLVRNPQAAAVIKSAKVKQLASSNGRSFRAVDKDSKDESGVVHRDIAPWVALAGDNLPRLFLASEDGTILYNGPLPKTVDEMLALLRKYGG